MNELALFAGAGGGILAGKLLGWRTVCAVERNAYAAQILAQRQNDGILQAFPIWSDVCSFDGRPWRGIVDVISGGFPCQDISVAGKGAGITGARSGLWKEFTRIIGEVRPRLVFVENSPRLRKLGLEVVIGDLAKLGYDAEWDVISAEDLGANHQRKRMWIVAVNADMQEQYSERKFFSGKASKSTGICQTVAYANGTRQLQQKGSKQIEWGWSSNSSQKMGDTNHNGLIAAQVRASATKRGNSNAPGQNHASQSARPSEQHAEMANATCLRSKARLTNSQRGQERQTTELNHCCNALANTCGNRPQRVRYQWPAERPIRLCSRAGSDKIQCISATASRWWATEPNVGRLAHGVAFRVDRINALGNGQVPIVAATAFESLSELLK